MDLGGNQWGPLVGGAFVLALTGLILSQESSLDSLAEALELGAVWAR
ncbi:UNVERIFIED_ORG: hypothetical protein ABIB52_004468 [Arthrobacter sp. UYCu721]